MIRILACALALFPDRARAVKNGQPTTDLRDSVAKLQYLAPTGRVVYEGSAVVAAMDRLATVRHCVAKRGEDVAALRIRLGGESATFELPRAPISFGRDDAVFLRLPEPLATARPVAVPESWNDWRRVRNRMRSITIAGFGGQDRVSRADVDRLVTIPDEDDCARKFVEKYLAFLNDSTDFKYARFLDARNEVRDRRPFAALDELRGRRVAHEVTREPRWFEDCEFGIRPRGTIGHGDSGGPVVANGPDGSRTLLGLVSSGLSGWFFGADRIRMSPACANFMWEVKLKFCEARLQS